MAKPGGCTTQAPGDTQDHIRRLLVSAIGGNIRARAEIMGRYRDKFYAFFVNGVYTGKNHKADTLTQLEQVLRMNPGTTNGSLYIEDAGDWPAFSNGFVPDGWAKEVDSQTARRMRISWTATYSTSTIYNDSGQITSVTVTGAKRFTNVQKVQDQPTRGQLTYSVTSSGTTRVIRWWAGLRLVAEGYRTGNGAFTCNPINGSGLTVAGTLTYSGSDTKPGVAYLEVCWPKSYQVHYSTSSLSYPRTPEATVSDRGVDNYVFLTPVLAAGVYNWSIVKVSDDGEAQSVSIPSPTAKTLNYQPSPPTITTVTGSATAGLTVNWTIGESGCTFTVYYSFPNEPINFGNYTNPPPLTTALNATSQAIPNTHLAAYANTDFETAWNTLFAAFDAQVSNANSAFATSQAAFGYGFPAMVTALKAAINAFGVSIGLKVSEYVESLNVMSMETSGLIASLPSGITYANWKNLAGGSYGKFLGFLGDILELNPGRYTLPNLSVPGGAPAGSLTLGVGVNSDGTAAKIVSRVPKSLKMAALPFVRNTKVQIVVRATKSGIQETHDSVFEVEFDNSGAIVGKRPNQAHVTELSVSNLDTVNVTGVVVEEDEESTASHLDLYVVARGASITFSSPDASVALPNKNPLGVRKASLSFLTPSGGWYDIVLVARNNTLGTRSAKYVRIPRYIGITASTAVANLDAAVIRGEGAI